MIVSACPHATSRRWCAALAEARRDAERMRAAISNALELNLDPEVHGLLEAALAAPGPTRKG